MSRNRSQLAGLTMLVLTLGAASLTACTRSTAPAAVSAATVPVAANLTLMTPEEKASQITSSFPFQVPVPVGDVRRGEAQGDSAWDYEIVVPGSVASVRRWYIEAYRNSEWRVTSLGENDVALQKHAAQTRLQFEAVSAGGSPKTQVTASVGVGTPVLKTQ